MGNTVGLPEIFSDNFNQAMTLLESICAQQRSIRKMKFLSCLFAVTWIIAQSAAAAPSQGQKPSADYVGVRLFLTEKGFGYLEEVAKELFVHDLQKITIPDITFDKDGFKGSLTSMKCTNAALNNLDLKATAGSIEMNADGLGVKCTGKWKYELKSWPHLPKGHGSVDVSVGGKSSLLAQIDISNNNENNTVVKGEQDQSSSSFTATLLLFGTNHYCNWSSPAVEGDDWKLYLGPYTQGEWP